MIGFDIAILVRRKIGMRVRRVGMTIVALAAIGPGVAAHAQTQALPTTISPLTVESDRNGVNIADGEIAFDVPTLSVPADPHLKFDRVQNAAPYITGKVTPGAEGNPSTSSYSVHYGGETSEAFTCIDSNCTSVTGSGSSLPTPNIFILAGSGAEYIFHDEYDNLNNTSMYYASRVNYPDGEYITYTYDTATLPGDTTHRTFYRPTLLTSNLGYAIAITYQGNDLNADPGSWGAPAQATLYSTAASSTPLAQLTYSGSTITDIAGRVYQCSGCSIVMAGNIENATESLQLPGEASIAKSTSAVPGFVAVASVIADGETWNYNYANLRISPATNGNRFTSVNVSGPDGFTKTYTVSPGSDLTGSPNLITNVTDALGHSTSYAYRFYRPTLITYPEGNSVSVTYDNDGNIISKVTKAKPGSGLPDLTESAYVDDVNCASGGQVLCYRPVWYKDALGRETDFVYNSEGLVTQETDPADASGVRRVTYTTYDAHDTGNGVPIYRKSVVRTCGLGTTCGTNAEIRTEYDYWANTWLPSTMRQIDASTGTTLTTTYTYDAAGRLLSEDGPLAGSDDAKYYRYDSLGRKTWEIGAKAPNGLRIAKRITYRDADDKVLSVETGTITDPNSTSLTVTSRVDYSYDSRRNASREALSANGTTYAVTDQSWTNRNMLLCRTVRMNLASLPTDACTAGTTGGFGSDRITKNVYDAVDQLIQVRKAVGTSLEQAYATYSYTPNGKQQYLIDADGNRAQLAYDGYDREVDWYFPSPTKPGAFNGATQATALSTAGSVSSTDYEAYGYDAVGNRTSLRKRDGTVISYTYDNLNRMTLKSEPGSTPTIFYSYDIEGHQLTARLGSSSGLGIANVYDDLGRLTSTATNQSGTTRTLAFLYDADGNRTRITEPDGVYFTYDYDALDRVSDIKENGATVIASYTYDAEGRRSAMMRGAVSVAYGYDGASRLTSLADDLAGTASDQTTTLAYNPADQIVTHTRSNDAYGFTGYVAVSRTYTTNGLNQYTVAGPASFAYDANGNLTSDGSTTYGYDAENRLTSASGGHTASLVYDPLGRLFQTAGGSAGTTQFLYDGDELTIEYSATGAVLRRYVHGPDEDDPILWYEGATVSASTRRSLQADHQGSIVSVADSAGNLIGIDAYDEYGIPNATNIGRFQYTGQAWLPEIGMYHYKARVYSPTLGRFLQTDPIGYKDQMDLYEYVGDDPVDRGDSTGEYQCSNPSQCKQVQKLVRLIKNAASQTPIGSRIPSSVAQALSSVGNALGSLNDGNNVSIGFGDAGGAAASTTVTDYSDGSQHQDVMIDSSLAGTKNTMEAGATLAHEGQHVLDNKVSGPEQNREQAEDREYRAYLVEGLFNFAYGRQSQTGTPSPGEKAYYKRLHDLAQRDCRAHTDVSTGVCS